MPEPIKMTSEQEYLAELDAAQEWAVSAGYSESDVNEIIKQTRQKKEHDNRQ